MDEAPNGVLCGTVTIDFLMSFTTFFNLIVFHTLWSSWLLFYLLGCIINPWQRERAGGVHPVPIEAGPQRHSERGGSLHEASFVVDGWDSALTTIQTAPAAVRLSRERGWLVVRGRGCEGQIRVWYKITKKHCLLKTAPALTSCCSSTKKTLVCH